ncbi:MAG: tetratricopeptide repeat protein, partial [Myxococcaceae bacterium]
PKPMPPKTQPVVFEPEPEPPHESTDPRIVNRGRVNRKVLDALKQVKRRDTAPEVSSSEPSVDEILADKLAAGSLQVAIRMEQNGRLDEAIRYLENSIAKSPDAPSLYNRLAIILMRERADLRRAEQLLQKAAELAPGHEVYEKNLAAVLAKRAMKK